MTVNWQNRIWEISTMQNETIKVLRFRCGIVTSNGWGSAAKAAEWWVGYRKMMESARPKKYQQYQQTNVNCYIYINVNGTFATLKPTGYPVPCFM